MKIKTPGHCNKNFIKNNMNEKINITLTVPEEYHLERIDKFLVYASELNLSRSYIQKLIREQNIIVNELPVKANYKAKTDDTIRIIIPEDTDIPLEPQNIPLDIVYEDSSIIVINKQPGLVVHPGPGNWDKTLVNGLLYHCKDLSSIGGVKRPGIVHRLDKDTSGLMIIAKNDISHQKLTESFSQRRIFKEYAAIIVGKPKQKHEVINKPIARHRKYRHKMTLAEDGKEAVTEYMLKKIWNTEKYIFSMLSVRIHTGRTHQIRVHLSSSGLPIVGDPIYSKKWEKHRVPYLLLASVTLGFQHPESGEELEFSVPLPSHMNAFIQKIENFALNLSDTD